MHSSPNVFNTEGGGETGQGLEWVRVKGQGDELDSGLRVGVKG